jgi:hypothetical protein
MTCVARWPALAVVGATGNRHKGARAGARAQLQESGHQMKTPTRRTLSLLGAIVGLAAFFAVALFPSLLYGGHAGRLLAGGIIETSGVPTLAVRILVVFGSIVGVTAVASLFVAGGAAVGAAASVLTGPAQKPMPHRK